MSFELPILTYPLDGLEPFVSAQIMDLHYNKHHAGYLAKLNKAIEGTDHDTQSIEYILTHLDEVPEDVRSNVRNNGGGFYNHSIFWNSMNPGSSDLSVIFREKLEKHFDSVIGFQKAFKKAALSQFGSGWAWLVKNEDGSMEIVTTANQDNPLSNGQFPLLGMDVWEHAYYLQYQNRRGDYIDAFFEVINWKDIEHRFNEDTAIWE